MSFTVKERMKASTSAIRCDVTLGHMTIAMSEITVTEVCVSKLCKLLKSPKKNIISICVVAFIDVI